MIKNWPTREQDLQAAYEIIDKYVDVNNGEPLVLVDVMQPDKVDQAKNNLSVPDWIMELTDHFVEEYGYTKGRMITERVLTQCLLSGQTIH